MKVTSVLSPESSVQGPGSEVRTLIFFCLFFSVVRPGAAQELLLGPSMSIEDTASQFANPALISFQRSKLALGARAYHLGLGDDGGVPLRQGFALLSSPFLFSDRFGAGMHVQYFDSPIYRRVAFGGSVSARILRYLSAGVSLEALSLSYNQDEFVGFDPRDPVFAGGFGKTVINLSIGLFAQPLPELRVSLGARNLNRPNLSLAGDASRQKIESFLGFSYGFGPAQALVEFVDTYYGLETRFGVEAIATSGSYLRLTSNDAFDRGRLEGQLYVGGPLSVSYGYELPLGALSSSSGGSHTFSVVLEFGRTPDLPDPISIPSFVYSNDLPPITPQLAPKVYISSSTDYVRSYEQRIVRKVDEDVPIQALQQLTQSDLGALDSTFVMLGGIPEAQPLESVSDEVRLQGSFSPLYKASMKELGRTLSEDSVRALTITSAGDRVIKAAGVRNYLIEEEQAPAERVTVAVRPEAPAAGSGIVPSEESTMFDPDRMFLFINASVDRASIHTWRLRIADMTGAEIKVFEGDENPPDHLEWNWRNEQGQLIEPGVYRYRLEWTDAQSVSHQSNERKLYVQKMLRKITIEVTRDIDALKEEADAVEIRIQH